MNCPHRDWFIQKWQQLEPRMLKADDSDPNLWMPNLDEFFRDKNAENPGIIPYSMTKRLSPKMMSLLGIGFMKMTDLRNCARNPKVQITWFQTLLSNI